MASRDEAIKSFAQGSAMSIHAIPNDPDVVDEILSLVDQINSKH